MPNNTNDPFIPSPKCELSVLGLVSYIIFISSNVLNRMTPKLGRHWKFQNEDLEVKKEMSKKSQRK
jgi:hypothetical protein